MSPPAPRAVVWPVKQSKLIWRKAPKWNQSSPIQPSTIGLIGAATFSAGCGFTSAITTVKPSYELPSIPTRPFDSGHVLHEPVDGVVGVGRVIDLAGVERPSQRPRHHVVPFRSVLAAHVLEHADVAVGDEHLVALRQRRQHATRIRSARCAAPRCTASASAGSARSWRPSARR